ncbi:MAG: phosphoribosylglycinamide formyltransferase [Bacteroidales bacterium]|jgi:phosphoribosylglycinamide formyltransferase-1
MKNVAIFASGSGTNAQTIIEHLRKGSLGKVSIILSNNKDAYVLERAKKYNIPVYVFTKEEFYNASGIEDLLLKQKTDLIVLAGFLWLVPKSLIMAFPNRIINIHPALLPNYGGKGMYGMHVHEEVIKQKEKESGISVHYVNEHYDEGNIIFQAKCKIENGDTPESLAEKIHALEHRHLPLIVERLLKESDDKD